MTTATTQTPLPEKGTAQAIDLEELHSRLLRHNLLRPYRQPSEGAEPRGSVSGEATYVHYLSSGTAACVPLNDISTGTVCYYLSNSFASGQAFLISECVNTFTDLSWGTSGAYPVSYLQPLDLVPGLLNFSGLPVVSGGLLNMPAVLWGQEKNEKEDEKIASFLNRVYTLAESGLVRSAAAMIMEYTDSLLLGGQFDECRRVLNSVDVSQLSKYPTLLVAFLGITLGAKDKLSEARSRFYASTNAALSRELGPDRAERILRRFQ